MNRRIREPLFCNGNRTTDVSRLTLAIAAGLATGTSMAAPEAVRYASVARAHADGTVPTHFETAAPPVRSDASVRKPTTLAVTSCADDGKPGTLRNVIASATDGNVIDLGTLRCDRIVLQQGMIEIDWHINDLTIKGPGRQALTIDGAGVDGVFSHAGFGTLDLRDLSIANGHVIDLWGACICAPSGNVRLSRVSVSSCSAHQVTDVRGSVEGGAIFAFGSVTLQDSEVLDSTASSELPGGVPDGTGSGVVIHPVVGGGIASIAGDIVLDHSRVSGNSAVATAVGGLGNVRGGGVYAFVGNVSVVDSTISGNHVSSGFEDIGSYNSYALGGGLHAIQGTLTISGSTIAGNELDSADVRWARGGGIAYFGSAARIENTTIENNRTTGDTGGLHNLAPSLVLVNSTISGNSATRGAGGLYDVGAPKLDHATIAFNQCETGVGGALLRHGGEMLNSIVGSNHAGGDAAADLALGSGASMTGSHDLIGDAGRTALPADTLRSDPLLLPLADNGGPTRTHALDPASPAIDAGSNAKDLSFDQRGIGFKRASGAAPDIGAFEVQQPVPEAVFADGFDRGFRSELR